MGPATINWSFLSPAGQLLDEAGNALSAGDPATRGDGTLLELLAWVGPGHDAESAASPAMGLDAGDMPQGSYECLATATVGDGMESFAPDLAAGRFSVSSNVVQADSLVGAQLVVRVWNAALTAYAELYNPAWHVPAALLVTSLDLGQAGTESLHTGVRIGDGYLTAAMTDATQPPCRVVRLPDRRCAMGQAVAVPVEINDAGGVLGFLIDIRYPAHIGVEVGAVACGALPIAAGWEAPVVDSPEPGRVVITASGSEPLAGPGQLIVLEMTTNAAVSPIPLRLARLELNDGGIPPVTRDGSLLITNRPPELGAPPDRVVEEEDVLTFTATASDPDRPSQPLAFSLDDRGPAGARIDPLSGVFSWRPTEDQGPGEYVFGIVVRDGGEPALTDRQEIRILVREVNRPPVLNVPGWADHDVGTEFSFTASASDPDEPRNSLAFSLDGREPGGATIDPATGVFRWAPSAADVGEYAFSVLVMDDGSPPLSDLQKITVTVGAPGEAEIMIDPPPVFLCPPLVIWCPVEGASPVPVLPLPGVGEEFLRETVIFTSQFRGSGGMMTTLDVMGVPDSSPGVGSSLGMYSMRVVVGAGETSAVSMPIAPLPAATGIITRVENGRIVDGAQTWTPGRYGPDGGGLLRHYLEIEGGKRDGCFWAITSNTTDSLTLDGDDEDDAALSDLVGAPYSVRPFRTVAGSLEGVGELPQSSAAEASAQVDVLLWDGSAFETLRPALASGRLEWRTENGESANAWPVYPDEGLMVANRGERAVEIRVEGEADWGITKTVVPEGVSFLGTGLAEDIRLGDSGLLEADGGPLKSGDSPAMADEVLVWNGAGYDSYYFSTFCGENVWRKAGGGPADDRMLEAGKAFFVNNRFGGAAVWTR